MVSRSITKPALDQLPVAPIERLIVVPEPVGDLTPNRPARFLACLESSGEVIVVSDQPLVDASRELIVRGFPAGLLLTLRHAGKDYDSFAPLPVSEWARSSFTESNRDGLRKVRWMPRQLHEEGEKSGFEGGTDVRVRGRAGPNFVPALTVATVDTGRRP